MDIHILIWAHVHLCDPYMALISLLLVKCIIQISILYHQHLVLSEFVTFATLLVLKCYLTYLFCLSLQNEDLFMLLAMFLLLCSFSYWLFFFLDVWQIVYDHFGFKFHIHYVHFIFFHLWIVSLCSQQGFSTSAVLTLWVR